MWVLIPMAILFDSLCGMSMKRPQKSTGKQQKGKKQRTKQNKKQKRSALSLQNNSKLMLDTYLSVTFSLD